jgi:SAM-dependent methyltransferase
MGMADSSRIDELLAQWRTELQSWAIPQEILDQAEVPPWIHPVELFTVDDEIPDTLSHRMARVALDEGDSVLDVGCGGGAASMALIPPAGTVFGVDNDQAMLDQYALAATRRGAHHREFLGTWPAVADEVPEADVVVCHHVAFNVPELGPFLQQLDWHARKRVVLEMPMFHPMSRLSPMWKHFWNLERPTGPSASDFVTIARELGFNAQVEVWADAVSWGSRNVTSEEQRLVLARRRLCLGADRTEELAAYLAEHPEAPVEIATIWWDVAR